MSNYTYIKSKSEYFDYSRYQLLDSFEILIHMDEVHQSTISFHSEADRDLMYEHLEDLNSKYRNKY